MPGQSVPSNGSKRGGVGGGGCHLGSKSLGSEDMSWLPGRTSPHAGSSATFPLDLELPVTFHRGRGGEGGRQAQGGEIQYWGRRSQLWFGCTPRGLIGLPCPLPSISSSHKFPLNRASATVSVPTPLRRTLPFPSPLLPRNPSLIAAQRGPSPPDCVSFTAGQPPSLLLRPGKMLSAPRFSLSDGQM